MLSQSSRKTQETIRNVDIIKDLTDEEDSRKGQVSSRKEKKSEDNTEANDIEESRTVDDIGRGRKWWRMAKTARRGTGVRGPCSTTRSFASSLEASSTEVSADSRRKGNRDVMSRGFRKSDLVSSPAVSSPSSVLVQLVDSVGTMDVVSPSETEDEVEVSCKDIDSSNEAASMECEVREIDKAMQEAIRLLDALLGKVDGRDGTDEESVEERILPDPEEVSDDDVVVGNPNTSIENPQVEISQSEDPNNDDDDDDDNEEEEEVEVEEEMPANNWLLMKLFPRDNWMPIKVVGCVGLPGTLLCGMNGCEDIEQAIVEEHGSCCAADDQFLPMSPYRNEFEEESKCE